MSNTKEIFTRSIWDDLQADEETLTFNDARKLPMFRREGRQPHVSVIYRWSSRGSKAVDGRTVVLEAVRRGDTKCTTRSACLRFIRQLSEPAGTPVRDSGSHAKAMQRLAEVL